MNTNTDFDKIDKVLSKNGGGLFCTCWTSDSVSQTWTGSHIADEVIKDGIKKMIAEYPDKYYVKNNLSNVL